ncbi:MAG: ADP-ribosylglycohydrolase family protein [Chiayiivirga sp.]|jgi:ADP-ribosylglycohydrolase/protein-tyrosine phosphatase|nr:ADP-ribosylglycohydrolase family protein [Chiayiivirga sp.]
MALASRYVFKDRLAGGLVGLLLGDAIGVPYEFRQRGDLPPKARIDLIPPTDFQRAHAGTPPGTWSDDGAQALCLLESLLTCEGLELDDFARRLLRWQSEGHLAVDGRVFDIGLQTQRALDRLQAGAAPAVAGPSGEQDNGNGALMRVLPLALWHQGADDDLVELAMRQSLPTHGHLRSQLCCALYCLLARHLLCEGYHESLFDDAFDALGRITNRSAWRREWDRILTEMQDPPTGSGYVVDSLTSAIAAFSRGDDYASVVREAISFGNDTDTTAALAGGLAGLRWGLYGIPTSWRDALRGTELYRLVLDALCGHHGYGAPASTAVRTSLSHPLQIGTLTLRSGGRLGVTFCPGKKQLGAMTGQWDRDVDLDLAAIRAWGAQHLVTLIQDHEFRELGVEALPERAFAHELQWHHAPILDGSIPDEAFEAQWSVLRPLLMKTLLGGGAVVVHCKGGLGRAGTIAARLLLELRECPTTEEAIQRVRLARPDAIETVAQEQYLTAISRRLTQGSDPLLL